MAIKRVLDGKVSKLSYLADKYAVRDYVSARGLKYILTPLLGIYDDVSKIDFSALPKRFALKANFGAGMNLICTDKSKLNYDDVRQTLQEWLNKPQKYSFAESHYNLIPHKIVCEEFIDDGRGGFPVDYKFLCLNGKACCILACDGRESTHAHYAHFDMSWNFIKEYDKLHRASGLVPKPKNLDEMVAVAEKLAEGIDLVRVDLYSNGKQIWFGEMTLTPAGCIFHGWSDQAIQDMGEKYYATKKS